MMKKRELRREPEKWRLLGNEEGRKD